MTPAVNAATEAFNLQIVKFGWLFVKLFFILVLVVLVIGIIIGPFTYNRPRRRMRRRNSPMEDIVGLGEDISHLLIDLILGKISFRNLSKGDWLNDQRMLSRMRGMKPDEFEEFMAEVFQKLGYDTTLVGGSGDGGIDIEMTKGGRNYVVQCKKYITRKVEPKHVREFFGAMGRKGNVDKGFLVTTNTFTLQAEQEAEGMNIERVEQHDLVKLVQQSRIFRQNNSVENVQNEKCPKCGKPLVSRLNHKDSSRFLGCSGFPGCRYTKSL